MSLSGCVTEGCNRAAEHPNYVYCDRHHPKVPGYYPNLGMTIREGEEPTYDDGLSGAINKVWEILETESGTPSQTPSLYLARRIVHELNKRGYIK